MINYIENIENIEEQERFTIDSPEKADWAIEKIKQAYKRRDIYLDVLEAKKQELVLKAEEIKNKAKQETEYLLYLLGEYMENLPCKESKTQKSFEFPSGKLVKKKPKLEFEPDKEVLIKELENTYFVTLEPKLKWGEFKKRLKIINGQVVDTDGQIYHCIKIKESDEEIEIK